MTRRKHWRMWIPAVLALVLSACSPDAWAKAKSEARDVAPHILDAARLLCLGAHASEKVGVTIDEIKDTTCRTLAEVQPWIPAVLGAQRQGAIGAGLMGSEFEANAGAQ